MNFLIKALMPFMFLFLSPHEKTDSSIFKRFSVHLTSDPYYFSNGCATWFEADISFDWSPGQPVTNVKTDRLVVKKVCPGSPVVTEGFARTVYTWHDETGTMESMSLEESTNDDQWDAMFADSDYMNKQIGHINEQILSQQ